MAHLLDGIESDDYDRRYSDRELARRITPYFRGKGRMVAFVTAAVVIAAIAGSAVPVLLAHTVDSVVDAHGNSLVALLVGALLITGVIAWIFTYLQERITGVLVGDVVLQLRQHAFNAAIRQDMAFFDTRTTGVVVSRVTNDTQAFATLITLVLTLLGQVLMILILMAVLFVMNIALALLTMLVAAVIVVVSLAFRRAARSASRGQQRALADVNGYVQESLRGIAVTRNYGRRRAVLSGLHEVNHRWFRASVRLNRLFSGIFRC